MYVCVCVVSVSLSFFCCFYWYVMFMLASCFCLPGNRVNCFRFVDEAIEWVCFLRRLFRTPSHYFLFFFFFLVKKGAFVGHVEVVARRVYRANIRLAICCRRGRCWQGLISWLACHFRQKPRKWCVNWFAGSSCHKPHLIRDFLLFSQIQICRARTRDLNLSHNSL